MINKFYSPPINHPCLEIKNIIAGSVRHIRTTRSSIQAHPFQVTLPNPRALAHKSSFIPRTSQQWNALPSTAFPESYNLSPFKNLISTNLILSLYPLNLPLFSKISLVGALLSALMPFRIIT